MVNRKVQRLSFVEITVQVVNKGNFDSGRLQASHHGED